MEDYLIHLKEDLQNAITNAPSLSESNFSESEDIGSEMDFSHVEQFLYGERKPLGTIIGIDAVAFPPIEKLSDNQASVLAEEMEKVLNAWNFVPDFPEGLPSTVKYRLLREKWNSEQVYLSVGQVHIEFCDYEPKNCPFPAEFCGCKEYE